jgi:glycerol-3-phosphate acyltransferase PlsY
MTPAALWTLGILGSYLAGSVPFGLLIGLARGIDIREHGSKNIGATNAGRVLGRRWGVLCFALDVLKGAAPVLLAGWATGAVHRSPRSAEESWLWIACAVAAVLGHMHSVFLRFTGGKGVATGFGVMLGLWGAMTGPALVALAAWALCARLTRYVSVSSVVAAATLPISVAILAARRAPPGSRPLAHVREAWPFLVMSVALAGLVIWKHRANLARLRAGTEPRIGARAGPRPGDSP